VQALGGCVASVAAMAMVRDFFPVEKSASIISLLVLILGASPLLAPTVGSYIIAWWGWHFVFVILAIITCIILLAVIFFLPKGQAPDTAVSLKPSAIARGYTQVMKEPRFYLYALAGSFSFSGLFVYVAHSPAIFMNHFQLSGKVYGAVFAILSIGFIGSSQLNHALTKRYSSATILSGAILVQCIAAILFAVGAWQNWYGLMPVIIFLFIILSCAGIVYPNAAALCMAPFEKNAGSASALLGFIQIGIGGLISASAGLLPVNAVLAMALITMATVVVAVIILGWGKRMKTRQSLTLLG
jgi:MFS transporter, DHA1 family, multidrug resistance protein